MALVDAEEMTFKGEFDLVVAGDVIERLNKPGPLRRGGGSIVAPWGGW